MCIRDSFQTARQDDVFITVDTVVILVDVTTDDIGVAGFFDSREHAVAGAARGDEDDVDAFGEQCVAEDLAARFVIEGTDVVAADICAGDILSSVGRKLDQLYVGAEVLICLLYTSTTP